MQSALVTAWCIRIQDKICLSSSVGTVANLVNLGSHFNKKIQRGCNLLSMLSMKKKSHCIITSTILAFRGYELFKCLCYLCISRKGI